MPSEIPEYYRHLAEKEAQEKAAPKSRPPASRPGQPRPEAPSATSRLVAANAYQAPFSMGLEEGWRDQTLYIIAGPATDGVQHNITVNVDPNAGTMALVDYVDMHTHALEVQLRSCRTLLKRADQLDSGQPAYRVIFVWNPSDALRLYQYQWYVMHEGTAYILTASFTKKTRKQIGPEVERMIRSFSPAA